MSLFSLIVVFIWVLLTSKSHQDQHQAVEMFKSANMLLDNASKLPLEKQNAKKMLELVRPNLFAILCNVKIEKSAKIGENLQKLHENFCGQLNEGKCIEEIAQNRINKTVAIKEIFEKMPQKIQKLPFINGKKQEMLSANVAHLLVRNNFLTKIRALKMPLPTITTNVMPKTAAEAKGEGQNGTAMDLIVASVLCYMDNNCTGRGWPLHKKCKFGRFTKKVCTGAIALCAFKMQQIAANDGPQSGAPNGIIGILIASMVCVGILLAISLLALCSYCELPANSSQPSQSNDPMGSPQSNDSMV